jgi:hypothetical protein
MFSNLHTNFSTDVHFREKVLVCKKQKCSLRKQYRHSARGAQTAFAEKH